MTTEMINSEGSKLYPLNTISKQVTWPSSLTHFIHSHLLSSPSALLFIPNIARVHCVLFWYLKSKVPSFRDRYVMFWTLLSEKLQSSEDQYVASKAGMSILKIITDQLVSLSRYYRASLLFLSCLRAEFYQQDLHKATSNFTVLQVTALFYCVYSTLIRLPIFCPTSFYSNWSHSDTQLRVVFNQNILYIFFSMAVVNVRDAVTEASLTVGQRAVACCVGLTAR